MKKAASEFEVPAGTKILMLFPEVLDRDILLKHNNFCFEYKDDTGNKQVGVKTQCPWCKTNESVKYEGRTGYKQGSHRTIAGYKECIPIISALGTCVNPACSGDPKKAVGDDSDKAKSHTFALYEPQCWAQYPDELKKRYLAYLYTDAADGKDGEILVSEELCMEVLKDKTVFLSLANDLHDSFE
jgi:hypothetical protein